MERKERTKNLVLCALFAALIAVGAFIRVPIPVIPFTLQFLFTLLAGLLLGGKWGAISVCIYIIIGLSGIPVFTQGGGIFYVLKPTFGYIVGFAFGTYVTGKIAHAVQNPRYFRLLVASFVGLGIVYLFGLIHYYLISLLYLGNPIGLWPLLLHGFLMTVPGDIVTCIFGAALGKRLIPIMKLL